MTTADNENTHSNYGYQPSTTSYPQAQDAACFTQEIALYQKSILHHNILDTSYARNREHHFQRCKPTIIKIQHIKASALLKGEPIDNKLATYREIRANDKSLAMIEGKAIHLLRSITGLDPVNVGSFGLLLNISSSDIDLGIGVFATNHFQRICERLSQAHFKYKQARETRYISEDLTTKRFVFSKVMGEIDIDVSIYHDCDLRLLTEGSYTCRTSMTKIEKSEHTWNKVTLKKSNMTEEYNLYKLEPYIMYNPGFKWVSIK
jgi:hypothetical protein